MIISLVCSRRGLNGAVVTGGCIKASGEAFVILFVGFSDE